MYRYIRPIYRHLAPRAFLICACNDVTSYVCAAYTNLEHDKKICLSRRLKRVGSSVSKTLQLL